jgi:predicted nucleotidyltransferase
MADGVSGTGAATEAIERALARALDAWSSIQAAWFFGSVATGSAGPLSDVDVAVLGAAGMSLDERARLTVELSRAVGRSCDVVTVERASPVLAKAIIDTGRRLLCRDADAADAWEDFALRRYLDTSELRRIVYSYVREASILDDRQIRARSLRARYPPNSSACFFPPSVACNWLSASSLLAARAMRPWSARTI